MSLSLPEGLERFRPVRLLGEGGFGRVLLCDDAELGRPVALKLVHASVQTSDALQRFHREARITASLRHPGVVTLYDHGVLTAGNRAWIAYEFLDGPDLAQLAAPPEAGVLTAWGVALATALAAAHEAGVVHRDVKPANVLLRGGKDPVLADFGLARDDDQSFRTQAGMVLGTPVYMAPELWRGAPPSPASDQYALAATLFELAAGVPVHPHGDPMGVLRRLEDGVSPPFEALEGRPTVALRSVLTRALAPRPEDRFPDLSSLAAALAATGAARATEVRQATPGGAPAPPSPLPTTQRVVPEALRRRSRHYQGLAVALVAGVLGGWAWRRQPPPPSATPPPDPEPTRRALAEQAWIAAQASWAAIEVPQANTGEERLAVSVPLVLGSTYPLKLRRAFAAHLAWIEACHAAGVLEHPVTQDRFRERGWFQITDLCDQFRQLMILEQEVYKLRHYLLPGESLTDTQRRFNRGIGDARREVETFHAGLTPLLPWLPTVWVATVVRTAAQSVTGNYAPFLDAAETALGRPQDPQAFDHLVSATTAFTRFMSGDRSPRKSRRAMVRALFAAVEVRAPTLAPGPRARLRVAALIAAFPLCLDGDAGDQDGGGPGDEDAAARLPGVDLVSDVDLVERRLDELLEGFPPEAADEVARMARDAETLRTRTLRKPPRDVDLRLLPRYRRLHARALEAGAQDL